MRARPKDAERDSILGTLLRLSRHPLRALTMAVAVFCLVADVALTTGVVGAIIGAIVGVFGGELLARSKLRLPWLLLGLAAVGGLALLLAALSSRVEGVVAALGTGASLRTAGFLQYVGLTFVLVASVRALARRHPSWLALELGFVVLAVSTALAAHRGGVIARPLWLSDWAWRRGMDPAEALMWMGIAAALVAVSLLLFERRGRLSVGALPLLPVVAMLAVSCLEVSGAQERRPEASPDVTDELGDPPNPDGLRDRDDDRGRGGPGGRDAGGSRDAGGQSDRGDAGRSGGEPDAGEGGGGADAGVRDAGGGGPGEQDEDEGQGGGEDETRDAGSGGGARDAGTTGGTRDAGTGGGGARDAGADAGGGGEWDDWDAGLDDTDLPPPSTTSGEGGTTSGAKRPEDLFDQPPPTGGSSSSPMAVVLFERDYSPPSGTYYFRHGAWSHFNGTRLVPTSLPEADRDVPERFPSGRLELDDPPPERDRAAVVARVAFVTKQDVPFALESPVWLADARNPNPQRFSRAYRFLSRSQEAPYDKLMGRKTGNPEWSDEQRALYLQPHTDPRFEEYARDIVGKMPAGRRGDPFARAVAIKLRLDETLIYSTRHRHADAEDPTVEFFFGNKTGYCVHFAHAAVYLWRAVGIPARVGTGFAVPERNRRGGSALLVRSGDAHAWPELYLRGVGWVVLDIAAKENLDPPRPPPDGEMQRKLGEMAREQPADPKDEIEDEPESSILPPASFWGSAFAVLVVLVLLAILVVLYSIKLYRRLAPAWKGATGVPTAAYRVALDRLAEVGLSRELGETREQFAKRVGRVSPSFEEATTLMLASKLGPPSSRGQPPVDRWREVTRAIGNEIKRGTKGGRRLLGLLHPLAFLDAR